MAIALAKQLGHCRMSHLALLHCRQAHRVLEGQHRVVLIPQQPLQAWQSPRNPAKAPQTSSIST